VKNNKLKKQLDLDQINICIACLKLGTLLDLLSLGKCHYCKRNLHVFLSRLPMIHSKTNFRIVFLMEKIIAEIWFISG